MWFSLSRLNIFIVFHQKVGQRLFDNAHTSYFCLMWCLNAELRKQKSCVAVIASRLDCLMESNFTERTHSNSHLSKCLSISLCLLIGLLLSISNSDTRKTQTDASWIWSLLVVVVRKLFSRYCLYHILNMHAFLKIKLTDALKSNLRDNICISECFSTFPSRTDWC